MTKAFSALTPRPPGSTVAQMPTQTTKNEKAPRKRNLARRRAAQPTKGAP